MATKTAPASSVVIDTGEMFRLRNDHPDESLVVTHGKRRFTIAPGQTALVPFEVIRVNWGDPRSRPGEFRKFSDSLEDGWVNKREAEIARLGVHYGSYAADVDTLLDPEWPLGDKRRGIVPKRVPWPVSVATEGGDIIVPACFDRAGDAVYGLIADETQNLDDQVQYREHLERRFDEMKAEIARLRGIENDDTEVDSPGVR